MKVTNICLAICTSVFLIACGGATNPNVPQVSNPDTRYKPICYAHMLEGKKYLKCTPSQTPKDSNVELLRFYSPTSIYPNYDFEREKNGKYSYATGCYNVRVVTAITSKKEERQKQKIKCNSYYFKNENAVKNIATNLIGTAAMAVGSVGMSLITAPESLTMSIKYFDHKFYNKILEDNKANFAKLYDNYQTYQSIIEDAKTKQEKLYKQYFGKENKNIKYTDKSGLLGSNKPCDISFSVGDAYNYLTPSLPPFSSEVNYKTYKSQISKTAQKYKAILNDRKIFSKLKNNIKVSCKRDDVYEYKITSLSTSRAKNGINLNANVLINSVEPKLLAPKTYLLKDGSLSVKLDFDGYNLKATYYNLTNKYLHVESLSSYVEKEIQTHSIGLELPPQGYVVREYLAKNIFALNEYGVSDGGLKKNNLSSRRLKYGWAVKYKFIDTSREHTIYNLKSYNLLSLYKNLYM